MPLSKVGIEVSTAVFGRKLSTTVDVALYVTSHRNVERQHIKWQKQHAADPERNLTECADPHIGGSVHPVSVLELTKNEVDGRVSLAADDRLRFPSVWVREDWVVVKIAIALGEMDVVAVTFAIRPTVIGAGLSEVP